MLPYSKIAILAQASVIFTGVLLCGNTRAQDYEVKPMTINSPEADFSGVFNGKDIIFCSNRAKMNLSFDDDSLTLYYTDLFQAKMKHDGTFSNPEPLKGDVNTDFNEGHVTFNSTGTTMYYTANLKRSLSNKLEKITEYKLGIFIAELINGQWVSKGEFQYNAPNSKYSVAHPCLSPNDSVLYFCSNMPGGEGNSDIYKCEWKNGQWTAPMNLGNKINGKGNEFFPFVNEFDVLFFSTDARNDSEGMDIYYSFIDEGEYQKPVKLNNTINSNADDFAYYEKRGVNQGTFSSNRNGEQDDIFTFNKYINTFKDCHENYNANFCYHLFDETLSSLDSLPFRYVWAMGDGTEINGLEVDYCYKNYGKYHVELNVIDTLTKVVFRKVSETDIVINKQDKPYIVTHDSIFATIPFEGKVEFFAFEEFEVEEINWELSDGTKYSGESFLHTFDTPGIHQVKCGIAGKRRKNGVIPMVCVYKTVVCSDPLPETKSEPLLCCDKREYEKIPMRKAELATNIESKQLRRIFKLIIAESKEPLLPDNALLSKIDAEIIEIRTDSSYQYAIAESENWEGLLPTYQLLRNEGYTTMYTEEFTRSELASKMNKIIPRNPMNAIKIHNAQQSGPSISRRHHTSPTKAQINDETHSEEFIYTTRPDSSIVEDNTIPVNPLQEGENVLAQESIYTTRPSNNLLNATTSNSNQVSPHVSTSETTYEIEAATDSVNTNEKFNNSKPSQANTLNKVEESAVIIESNEDPAATNITEIIPVSSAMQNISDVNSPDESPNMALNDVRENANHTSQTPTQSAANIQDASQKTLYRIIFKTSKERLPFNDPCFSQVKAQITELHKDHGYEYAVMAVPNAEDLGALLQDLQKKGFSESRIEPFVQSMLQTEVLRTGRYIAPGDAKKLNVEFSKLSDIKFEYNSAEISPESHKNLNYIAAMLKLEEDFTLRVSAHTCTIGGDDFNIKLSEKRAESVVNYFISKGISKERLISHGYGAAKPLQTNESEMGRAANRRVEFVIVFNIGDK